MISKDFFQFLSLEESVPMTKWRNFSHFLYTKQNIYWNYVVNLFVMASWQVKRKISDLVLTRPRQLWDWFTDQPWASTTVVTEMSFKLCFFNSSLISKHWARYGDRTRISSSLIPSFASWRATWTWKYKHIAKVSFFVTKFTWHSPRL